MDKKKDWNELLKEAVEKPGTIAAAYTAFHGYSIGNRILALWQCHARGIEPGPIATFPGWKEKGRYVKRGEKALTLCMPITMKKKAEADEEKDEHFTRFVYRNRWFVLSQTDGKDYKADTGPSWDKGRALEALRVAEESFSEMNGNVQGYATSEGAIAVNPVAAMPHKTLFHELAHQVLGHCESGKLSDTDEITREVKEVEAESVALICCESLGLNGADESRGYIQNWSKGNPIPEKSAQRIFSAANKILEAGA